MKRLVILGAGTAGSTVANRLRSELEPSEWSITVIDESPVHYYQPGFLFVPFGKYERDDLVRSHDDCLARGIDLWTDQVERIDPVTQLVALKRGAVLAYDYLVIATGTRPRPDQTPGMDSEAYGETIHDFYTLEGAEALREALQGFQGGRIVVHVTELPIKCPVAPLEFSFLADEHFEQRGIRDRVDITYVTPLDGAFTKPVAAAELAGMLRDRDIHIEPDFYTEHVDPEAQQLVSYDERAIDYDLLVTVPVNMGADFVGAAGLGDELNHVLVDRHTLQSTRFENISALGDAAALPTSKAGSVAHFAADVFVENFLATISGDTPSARFDGHANCFVETGDGKAMLLDFNYDTQPLPGSYPTRFGPFSLLKESRVNHWGKLAFRPIYWNVLIKGRPLPVGSAMPDRPTQDHEGKDDA